ncbi:MAG: bifunctional oligoribonuclease/PAP phosphatase NrnA [Thermoleophilia bacterium]
MSILRGDVAAVCRRMLQEDRAGVAIHEKPDVDAVGACAGMLDAFRQLGVQAALYVDRDVVVPLAEYLLGDSAAIVRGIPDVDTTLYVVDSGTRARVALALDGWTGSVVNIDHHGDNDGFGDLVLLRPETSSASEIVCEIDRALGLVPSPQAARALFAGISFDTGHFRHTSTSAATFAQAAWLREIGVDVTDVYRRLYESRSPAALRLWARAIGAARTVGNGAALIATLTQADFAATGATDEDTEGIVDALRAVDGVNVAGVIKEQATGSRVRVSLRADALDVRAIAALRGGGGHRLAAGFSSDESPGEVEAWLSSELAKRLSTASS